MLVRGRQAGSATSDIIHNVLVRDEFRWLEDRSLPETEEWIREQGIRYDKYFLDCPYIPAIRDRVATYLQVDQADQYARVGNVLFYRKRTGCEQQASIYTRVDTSKQEVLLVGSPSDQALISIGIHKISQDGSLLAYEERRGGSKAVAIKIVKVKTGEILDHGLSLGHVMGFTFSPRSDGYYYCLEKPGRTGEHTISCHRFDDPAHDEIIFRAPRGQGSRLHLISDEARLGAVWIHEKSGVQVVDLAIAETEDNRRWINVFADRQRPYSPILAHGRIFVLTHADTGTSKLLELTEDGVGIRQVLQTSDGPARQLQIAGDAVYVCIVRLGETEVFGWTLSGEPMGPMAIPKTGTIQLFRPHCPTEKKFFYTYESYGEPPATFEYDPTSHQSTQCHHTRPVSAFRVSLSADSCLSEDGTRIPITLVARQPISNGQPSPTVMTAYGGFGVSMTPYFSVLVSVLMDLGATFMIPHVRGGGEFGEDWHNAARGDKRQTSINDYLAAAEWISASKRTTAGQLGSFGACNSALLAAAAMTQRPELFGGVLCISPLLDMVRYERFDRAARWRPEFGSVDNVREFHALYSYSPYHRVRENTNYPPTMFVTGDSDDQVNPAHVRKTAARLSCRSGQLSPILVDYSDQRGHSPSLSLEVRIEALSRRIAFFCKELGITVPFGGLQ